MLSDTNIRQGNAFSEARKALDGKVKGFVRKIDGKVKGLFVVELVRQLADCSLLDVGCVGY